MLKVFLDVFTDFDNDVSGFQLLSKQIVDYGNDVWPSYGLVWSILKAARCSQHYSGALTHRRMTLKQPSFLGNRAKTMDN